MMSLIDSNILAFTHIVVNAIIYPHIVAAGHFDNLKIVL